MRGEEKKGKGEKTEGKERKEVGREEKRNIKKSADSTSLCIQRNHLKLLKLIFPFIRKMPAGW